MLPDSRFIAQPKAFWANVRSISQQLGYTTRGTSRVRVYSAVDMTDAMGASGLGTAHLVDAGGLTRLGHDLEAYFAYRADVLNTFVEPRLMDAEGARELYSRLLDELSPSCPLPTNKQKNEKAGPALFTGMINMLIEANADGVDVDYDPRKLTTVTRHSAPLRTLARRVDGAFPSSINPVAIWEIKEYYYTTTFGSRVADGVYETLLDGLELEELREHEGLNIHHVLMVDSHYTWWRCGRSYLCRIVDMLNMGAVDEVLFGREIVDRLPILVRDWVRQARARV
jgi:hypothetical protein